MPLPNGLSDAVTARFPRYLEQLETLVGIDSGSYTPAGVNRVADAVASRLAELGARVNRIGHRPESEQAQLGDLLVGRLKGEGPRLLLIGHMDTVFDPGTAAARPFRRDGDRATGPGTSDMKGGLLAGIHAIGALHAIGLHPSITFVANPDEEIGSPFSAPVIRDLVREHDAAFVLECARANGDIVSARKGIADIEVMLTGRAAHAGVEPEKGRSAILAAAGQITALHGLNGRWPGVTLNVGVIQGGTRPNVVAERCSYKLDLRATTTDAFATGEDAVARLVAEPAVSGVTAQMRRIASHPPMEKSASTARLAELAIAIAAEIGFPLRDTATGGASDANTTAAAGLPTLDGLGPVGGDDHSADEWLDLSSVIPRIALLAGLIARVGDAL
jgi:glutamate carboxypeptidase